MLRTPTISAALLAVAALSGCGGDDATSDDAPSAAADDTGGGSGAVDGNSDAGSNGGAAADLGDFPIPVPADSTLTFTNEIDDITAHTITVPIDQMEAAIAFYDDWTASEDDEYQRIVAEAGGVSWVRTTGSSADSSRIILVSAPLDGDTEVIISLTDDPPG